MVYFNTRIKVYIMNEIVNAVNPHMFRDMTRGKLSVIISLYFLIIIYNIKILGIVLLLAKYKCFGES